MQNNNNKIQSSSNETQVTLRTKALSKIYQTGEVKVHALREVDLSLYESELVVLLGASGSGKSTLVNIIGGLDTPTSGQVFFYDDDLTAYNDHKLTLFRRENVGFVFQFYNLIPSLTALENVALVTEISKNPMQPEDALEIVGLTERINHFPAQLSGGEQQRVAIARAIAKRPSILLCDEPTGALDSKTGILVLEAIERVNQDLGTTTILITHNAVISDMADRVITLADGQIISISENSQRCKPKDLIW